MSENARAFFHCREKDRMTMMMMHAFKHCSFLPAGLKHVEQWEGNQKISWRLTGSVVKFKKVVWR